MTQNPDKEQLKMKTERCPYCGIDILPNKMSERAYAYHYDAECRDDLKD